VIGLILFWFVTFGLVSFMDYWFFLSLGYLVNKSMICIMIIMCCLIIK